MYYMNDGFIEIKDKFVDEFCKLWAKEETENKHLTIIKNYRPGMSVIEISDYEGDIEDVLKRINNHFVKKGERMNGAITYLGDYNGRYLISNGVFKVEGYEV